MCIRVWKQYKWLPWISLYLFLSCPKPLKSWIFMRRARVCIFGQNNGWEFDLKCGTDIGIDALEALQRGRDQGSYFQLDEGAKAELVIRMVIFWFRKTNNKLRRFIPSLATTWRLVHELSPDCGGCSKNTQSCTVCQYNLTFKNISVINLYL